MVLCPSPPVQLPMRRDRGMLVASGETWAIFVLSKWVICRRGGSSLMSRLCGLPKFHCPILGLSFLPSPT